MSKISHAVVALMAFAFIGEAACVAAPAVVGNWMVQKDTGWGSEAWTVNASGSQLGVLCYQTSGCLTYFIPDSVTCDDGGQYPALLNTELGAVSLSAVCKRITTSSGQTRYVMVIDEYKTVLGAILKDHVLGIVIPMADGAFSVARFSLDGSRDAIAAVNQAMKPESKPAKATGDQVL